MLPPGVGPTEHIACRYMTRQDEGQDVLYCTLPYYAIIVSPMVFSPLLPVCAFTKNEKARQDSATACVKNYAGTGSGGSVTSTFE